MGASLKLWARALRVEQWTKSGLVLLAWFFSFADSGRVGFDYGLGTFLMACAMALSFALVSSAFYLFNDVSDYASDRLHPVKRLRPVAADLIPRPAAIRAALGLLAVGVAYPAVAAMTSPSQRLAFATILAYAVLQCLYTGSLKRVPYVDVVALAFGFVLRAVAGAAVVTCAISAWLLVCTFTLSLFLALCKRKSERETALESRTVLRSYRPKVLDALILATGAASVAEYLAYTFLSRMGRAHPYLCLTSLFVLAGVLRYMRLAWTGRGTDRPEKILLNDRILWLILVCYGCSVLAAVGIG